ncbi:MAG: hypothetical protein Q9167_005741 [Letrouitia subvulpina]
MADHPANSASTFLELAWTSPHISIGTGYDFAGRQLKDRALTNIASPSPQAGERKFSSNIHSVSTNDELKTRIKADFKADVPLEGVSIKTENSYLSSVATSDTSLTQIIQEIITDPPARVDVHQVQLTEDARKILDESDGWKRFSKRYGEYFVYGYVPRALFSAICTIKTNSKSVRDEIKTSLEVDVEKVGSLTAALKSLKETKSASVTIDINLEVTGLQSLVINGTSLDNKTEVRPKATKTNKVEEVQILYENFQKSFQTQPYIALLCHYSVLNTTGNIPLPMNQFDHLGPDLEGMYKNLYTAQVEISTSPMVQASATSKKIVTLCDKIKTLDLTKGNEILEVRREVVSCLSEVDLWRLRSDLIGDVEKLKNDKMNWGNWTEASSQKEWASGVLGLDGHPKYAALKDEVSYKDAFRSDHKFG